MVNILSKISNNNYGSKVGVVCHTKNILVDKRENCQIHTSRTPHRYSLVNNSKTFLPEKRIVKGSYLDRICVAESSRRASW